MQGNCLILAGQGMCIEGPGCAPKLAQPTGHKETGHRNHLILEHKQGPQFKPRALPRMP